MTTTKSLGQKSKYDKFYTRPEVASFCISQIPIHDYDIVIEPSAGSGSFSSLLKNCRAYDIAPEADGIEQLDFLKFNLPEEDKGKKILVIGNPPFGVQNNLAIGFFNHSAGFADTIAFILPKSFRKPSIQDRLSLDFSLFLDIDLERNSFILDGENYDVPTVFQVWKRHPRKKIKKLYKLNGIEFVSKEECDFRIQRVGGNAGRAFFNTGSKQSNYFIKNTTGIDSKVLVELINKEEQRERNNTVGPRSISKPEILEKIRKIIENNNEIYN